MSGGASPLGGAFGSGGSPSLGRGSAEYGSGGARSAEYGSGGARSAEKESVFVKRVADTIE